MPAGGSPIAPLANAKTSGNPSDMIVAPAVALMIAGLWKISWATFGWLDLITGGKFFGNHISNLLLTSYVFLSGLLILFGGYQMLKRGSYGWAVAAGIFSVMACSLISPPIGIWALLVLAPDDVNPSLGASNYDAPMAPLPERFCQRFAVVIACVILIPIAVATLGFLAAVG